MFIPPAWTLCLPPPVGLPRMCVAPLVIISLLLGAFLHGDMDDKPLFDRNRSVPQPVGIVSRIRAPKICYILKKYQKCNFMSLAF